MTFIALEHIVSASPATQYLNEKIAPQEINFNLSSM